MSRVTTACSSCRTRRSKCDGARPRCGNCARLDLGCEYSLIDGRKSRHTEGEVKALRDRIRHLEQQLEDSTAVVDRLVRAAVPRDNWWSGESHLAALEQGDGEADGAGTQQSFDELGQVGFLAGSLPGNWELDLPDGDDVLAQASPSQSSEATSAGSVIDTLSAVLGKLRFDQESGEPYYLGPTSSLHLPRLNPRLGRPHTAQLAQFQLYFPPPELPGHLRDIYRTTVHRHLPMVQLAKLDGVKDTSEFAINPDLLTTQILALASWFLQPDDPWYSHREACMDYYQNSFTVTVGYEMDRVSLANAQAFVLRAYMGILQGSLDAANIFLGTVALNFVVGIGILG